MQNLAVRFFVFRELQLLEFRETGFSRNFREIPENSRKIPVRTVRDPLSTKRAAGRLRSILVCGSVSRGPLQSSFYRHTRFFVPEIGSGASRKTSVFSRNFRDSRKFQENFRKFPGKSPSALRALSASREQLGKLQVVLLEIPLPEDRLKARFTGSICRTSGVPGKPTYFPGIFRNSRKFRDNPRKFPGKSGFSWNFPENPGKSRVSRDPPELISGTKNRVCR